MQNVFQPNHFGIRNGQTIVQEISISCEAKELQVCIHTDKPYDVLAIY